MTFRLRDCNCSSFAFAFLRIVQLRLLEFFFCDYDRHIHHCLKSQSSLEDHIRQRSSILGAQTRRCNQAVAFGYLRKKENDPFDS